MSLGQSMNDQTGAVAMLATPDILRRVVRLQILTVVWMTVEVVVALAAAWTAKSPSLLGFGGDSAVELLSAIVVLWRFRSTSDSVEKDEKLAARVTGLLLFALAVFLLGSSFLAFTRFRPQPSYLGIALLVAAAIGMPWLSHRKKALAIKTSSASLKADAVQSAMCAYLAWIALGGLLVNAVFHASWADPIAALLLVPIILREGWESMHARTCC